MRGSASFFTTVAIVLAIIIFVLLYFFVNWSFYLSWLISLSVSTFFLFGVDKMQARLGNWRIPEWVLLAFSFSGGVAGGWAGMGIFWHKVRNPKFWVVLILVTVIHCGAALWLFS
jgi:uncharacterized membrane protein YsdA (DUF1294 family)